MAQKRIIIFDDEPDILKVTEARLKESGFEIMTCSSSKNALAEIRKFKPDLVLLDVVMPYKDGYQVCDEIRTDEKLKDLPVIVFTAQPLEKNLIDKASGFYGATDHVAKPFKPEELLRKIKKYLS